MNELGATAKWAAPYQVQELLTVSDGESFMGDFNFLDGNFIALSGKIGGSDLGGPRIGQGPHHGRRARFIKQFNGYRYALDGVHLDLAVPVPE